MKYMMPIIAAALLLQACAAVRPNIPSAGDTTSDKDPLEGKIIDTRTRDQISYASLVDHLAAYDVIYLSEKHDNPMHHAIQHRIIQELTRKGRPPVVGFEFFSMDQTPLLLSLMDSQQAKHTPQTEEAMEKEMRKKLGWENQTDTMWGYYWDLLRLARENGLWAAGLDLNTSLKRRITRKGTTGLTPLEQDQLFSTHLSDPAYEKQMKETFKQVHCGMGHERMLARLWDTWLARNDKMALSITQLHRAAKASSPPKGPVVVIVGNGHTEYALGIMDRVRKLAPALTQVNLSMSEVATEPAPLEEYLEPLDLAGYPPAMPADFIWFTPRVSNEDPCAKFKATLRRMKQKKKAE